MERFALISVCYLWGGFAACCCSDAGIVDLMQGFQWQHLPGEHLYRLISLTGAMVRGWDLVLRAPPRPAGLAPAPCPRRAAGLSVAPPAPIQGLYCQ